MNDSSIFHGSSESQIISLMFPDNVGVCYSVDYNLNSGPYDAIYVSYFVAFPLPVFRPLSFNRLNVLFSNLLDFSARREIGYPSCGHLSYFQCLV